MKKTRALIMSALALGFCSTASAQTNNAGAQIIDDATQAVLLQCKPDEIPLYLFGNISKTEDGKITNFPDGFHHCTASQSPLSVPEPTGSGSIRGLTIRQCPAPTFPLVISMDAQASQLAVTVKSATYRADAALTCIDWNSAQK